MSAGKLMYALNDRRQQLLAMANQEEGDIALALRDAADLIGVLVHVVDGKEVMRAFGAPGDWGYGTPIGDGLLDELRRRVGKVYRERVMSQDVDQLCAALGIAPQGCYSDTLTVREWLLNCARECERRDATARTQTIAIGTERGTLVAAVRVEIQQPLPRLN